jgi:hypothetical protein
VVQVVAVVTIAGVTLQVVVQVAQTVVMVDQTLSFQAVQAKAQLPVHLLMQA